MKQFFRELGISIRDAFENIKHFSKKTWIIIASIVLVIIIAIVVIICVHNERSKEIYDSSAIASSYAQTILNDDYYTSYDYTIAAKNGKEEFIKTYMGDDVKISNKLTKSNKSTVDDITDVLINSVTSYANLNGLTDVGAFSDYFIDEASTIVSTYESDGQLTSNVLVTAMENTLDEYKDNALTANKEEYADEGYSASVKLKEEYDFSKDDVELYRKNKSDDAVNVLKKCDISTDKIKNVKRFTYTIYVNDNEKGEMKFYLIEIGSKWYVDTTAKIY